MATKKAEADGPKAADPDRDAILVEILTLIKDKLCGDTPGDRDKIDRFVAQLGGPDRTGKA